MTYQLVSTTPGVTVRLTQNPLNAKIVISEEALAKKAYFEHKRLYQQQEATMRNELR